MEGAGGKVAEGRDAGIERETEVGKQCLHEQALQSSASAQALFLSIFIS